MWLTSRTLPKEAYVAMDPCGDKLTIVHVMSWCLKATSHYLNQHWCKSLVPINITRGQNFNSTAPEKSDCTLNLVILKVIPRIISLTHWGRVTHICVGKLTITGSDNGLSAERRQAIIWTNAGILLIGPLGTNFSEIIIEIQTFSSKKIRLKMSSAKCCSFRLGLNVLTFAVKLPSGEYHKTSLMMSQYWFR